MATAAREVGDICNRLAPLGLRMIEFPGFHGIAEKTKLMNPANRSRVGGLDGLRAISAVMVILFHLDILQAGWAGVEVFFVISGFLITRILIGAADDGTSLGPYLGRFFWRRSLRIFPLYYLVLLPTFLLATAWRHAPTHAQIARATYTYNWYRAFHQYSDTTQLGSHFWSLASEEQFYLAWPFIVYFLFRRGWLPKFAAAMVVAGVALRFAALWLFSADRAPWIVYHAGVFQIGALALGALIACSATARVRRASWWALALTLAAIALGAAANRTHEILGFSCTMPSNYQWIWGYLAIDLISAALVIACVQAESITRVLEWRPLARLGQVSYGFYVFHPYVVFALALVVRHMWHRDILRRPAYAAPIAILLTWALAELSFRQFESRFLKLRDRFWSEAPRVRANEFALAAGEPGGQEQFPTCA